jgi:hypothetical protein
VLPTWNGKAMTGGPKSLQEILTRADKPAPRKHTKNFTLKKGILQ